MIGVLLHTVCALVPAAEVRVIVLLGFTVIVKVIGKPTQVTPPLVKLAVTVIVAVTGTIPGFWATKVEILPEPLGANPMDGRLLVQLKTIVPPVDPAEVGLLKMTGNVLAWLHSDWLATGSTTGVGLTVIVKLCVGPVQAGPPPALV